MHPLNGNLYPLWRFYQNISPNTNKEEDTHNGHPLLYFVLRAGGTRKIKCGADERHRRGLDRAEHLFLPIRQKCKRVPSGVPIKDGYFDRVAVLIVFA